jgi:hypothetical protein
MRSFKLAAPTIQRLCGLCLTWYAGVQRDPGRRRGEWDSCARTNLQAMLPISFAACGPETVLTHDARWTRRQDALPMSIRYWAPCTAKH